jgi:glycosyltransferase involved in cell wall biosynthesis
VRILLFSSYFPTHWDPTRGIFNLQQARALSRCCEVQVVAPLQWFPVRVWHGAGPADDPHYEIVEGLPTWRPRYFLTPGVARDSYAVQMGAAMLPFLARIRKKYPFDVMLATWAFPDVVVGAAAASLCNWPLLGKVHSSDVYVQGKYALRRRQIRWAMNRTHRVLAVSQPLGDALQELGVPAEKVMVALNGVDTSRFEIGDREAGQRQLGLDTNEKHVVFVGYLRDSKAVHVLLDALGKMKRSGARLPQVHLVGDGPLEGDLRRQAAVLGIENRVHFAGWQPHEQIPVWMSAADVFCLPSIREGCPNVMLEALASGRPVVATNVGAAPDLASKESAILVPPSDAEALAGGLIEALNRTWDPELIRASVADRSWDSSARAIFEAAGEALELHPTARRSTPVAIPSDAS